MEKAFLTMLELVGVYDDLSDIHSEENYFLSEYYKGKGLAMSEAISILVENYKYD